MSMYCSYFVHKITQILSKEIVNRNLAPVASDHLYDRVKLSQDRPSIAMFAPVLHVNGEGRVFLSQELAESSTAEATHISSNPYFQHQLFQYLTIFPQEICIAKHFSDISADFHAKMPNTQTMVPCCIIISSRT